MTETPKGPTISGDIVSIKCRDCDVEQVRTPDGYKCPKCGKQGIKLSGGASIKIS